MRLGSTQQSVFYRSSGVILEVTPKIIGQRISLDLHQELSSFAATETGVSGSPTLQTRQLDTTLDMASGEWAIVGVLASAEVSEQHQSFLGLVPIGREKRTRKSDLVLLVSARFIDAGGDDDKAG